MSAARWLLGWLSPIAAVITGSLLTARQLQLPAAGFWVSNAGWLGPLVFVLTVFTLGYQAVRDRVLIAQLNRNEKDDRTKGLDANIKETAQYLFLMVQREADDRIGFAELAVNVWIVPLMPRNRPMNGEQALQRLASFKVHQRHPLDIAWTKGKGLVGRCWENADEQWLNLESIHVALASGTLDSVPDNERLGLDDGEIKREAAYWAIFATAIKDEKGAVIGVVSVDSSQPHSYDILREATDANVVVGGAIRLLEKAVSLRG
jgi:hypothetical protein